MTVTLPPCDSRIERVGLEVYLVSTFGDRCQEVWSLAWELGGCSCLSLQQEQRGTLMSSTLGHGITEISGENPNSINK